MFHRVVVSGNYQTAVDEVTAEVNAFLATLVPTAVLEIRYAANPAASQVFYAAHVIFLQE